MLVRVFMFWPYCRAQQSKAKITLVTFAFSFCIFGNKTRFKNKKGFVEQNQ